MRVNSPNVEGPAVIRQDMASWAIKIDSESTLIGRENEQSTIAGLISGHGSRYLSVRKRPPFDDGKYEGSVDGVFVKRGSVRELELESILEQLSTATKTSLHWILLAHPQWTIKSLYWISLAHPWWIPQHVRSQLFSHLA